MAGRAKPRPGVVAPSVRAEFPALRLQWVLAPAGRGPSPAPLRARLAQLSDRYRGASVVAMRTQSVAHAYRSFFRQVGLDPDVNRIPSEQAAIQRLLHGGFASGDWLADAVLLALLDTGVPVWAVDGDLVDDDGLVIRTSVAGEQLGSPPHARALAPGRLVVAGGEMVHALLFEDVHRSHRVTAASHCAALFAVAVSGVTELALQEALWTSVQALSARRSPVVTSRR